MYSAIDVVVVLSARVAGKGEMYAGVYSDVKTGCIQHLKKEISTMQGHTLVY